MLKYVVRSECIDPHRQFYFRVSTFITISRKNVSHNSTRMPLPWVGPELGSGAVGRELVRALEAYYRFRVAQGDELVRPDARVGLGVVGETGIAVGLMRLAVDALDVTGAASVTVRIHAELILAARAADGRVCKKKNDRHVNQLYHSTRKRNLVLKILQSSF